MSNRGGALLALSRRVELHGDHCVSAYAEVIHEHFLLDYGSARVGGEARISHGSEPPAI